MDILHELIGFFSAFGYLAVFLVLVACGFGLPLPEDITLVSSGVICGLTPDLNVHIMLGVTMAGVLIGDGAMFMLGRLLGAKVKRLPLLKHIFTEKVYRKMQEKVHKYGNRILFVARFLPGLRAPIFITAGISRKVSLWKFLLMDGSAALISVPVWVYAGYYFAHDLPDLIEWIKHSETFVFSVVGVVVLAWIGYTVVKKYKRKHN
jgi:membrane protein DedA with SNARE-associated domain